MVNDPVKVVLKQIEKCKTNYLDTKCKISKLFTLLLHSGIVYFNVAVKSQQP